MRFLAGVVIHKTVLLRQQCCLLLNYDRWWTQVANISNINYTLLIKIMILIIILWDVQMMHFAWSIVNIIFIIRKIMVPIIILWDVQMMYYATS